MAGESIRQLFKRGSLLALMIAAGSGSVGPIGITLPAQADWPTADADSGRRTAVGGLANAQARRKQAIASLPLDRLTAAAQQRILSIAQSPTLYRRLPSQAIRCDRDMFLVLTRNPEILVGLWDLMGVTKVKTRRTAPFQLEAEDGIGTTCQIDLVYGDPQVHIYVADGSYDGKLVAAPIRGQAVFIMRSDYATAADGSTTVTGTLDCFIQFDQLGADLIARTLSGLIGRSADHNFQETARFIAQVSEAAEKNQAALIEVAQRIPQVSPATRKTFVDAIVTVARRRPTHPLAAAR